MWPSVGTTQGWNAKIAAQEPIYDSHKGEKPRVVGLLDVNNRRTMEAEITKRAVDFIKRNANVDKPFFAYVSFSLMHMPTLPNADFVGKTGWSFSRATMAPRLPTLGREIAGRGGAPISPRWKPHSARRSLSAGPARCHLGASTMR